MVGDILILDKLWRWIKGMEGWREKKHISEGHKWEFILKQNGKVCKLFFKSAMCSVESKE